MDIFKKGWFTELSPDAHMWPGQALSIEIESTLFDEHSEFQHVQVFETKEYGTMLCLDGVIQVTERDEFGYQEMIANIPMCAHRNPKRVAVIGGGDGGVLREIVRHDTVELVDHCEIDQFVCDVSRKFLPSLASGLDHPVVTTRFRDGAAWLQDHTDYYDVVIVDSSDPVGPAATLFEPAFYQTMKASLRQGGVICTQGECQWNNLDLIVEMLGFCKSMFKHADYAFTTVPTYPSGQIGFIMCSDSAPTSTAARPHPKPDELRYYTPEVHKAAFVLPKFAADAIAAGAATARL